EAPWPASGLRVDDAVGPLAVRTTATIEREPTTPAYDGSGTPQKGSRTAVFDDERRDTPVYAREALPADHELTGPAVLEGTESTVVIPPSWTGTVRTDGTVVLEGDGESRPTKKPLP